MRESTFFGGGVVGHVSFGTPFCPVFSEITANIAENHSNVHRGGTYVCMEGPQFSTKAESIFYREQLKATVVGMTGLPEAKLAREAGLHYAMVALATDYDCWNETEGEVSAAAVVAVVKGNVAKANGVILDLAKNVSGKFSAQTQSCSCASATSHAVMTAPSHISAAARERLHEIVP